MSSCTIQVLKSCSLLPRRLPALCSLLGSSVFCLIRPRRDLSMHFQIVMYNFHEEFVIQRKAKGRRDDYVLLFKYSAPFSCTADFIWQESIWIYGAMNSCFNERKSIILIAWWLKEKYASSLKREKRGSYQIWRMFSMRRITLCRLWIVKFYLKF